MSMGERDGSSVTDDAVVAMVEQLQPDWTVEVIEVDEQGSDFIAHLTFSGSGAPDGAVLKATTAEWMQSTYARAEPRMLSLVAAETDIPVPTVYGYCDRHERLPAPFFLMSEVSGRDFNGQGQVMDPKVREAVIEDAGRYLASLHEIDTLSMIGRIGVEDGTLQVVHTEEHPSGQSFHPWLLDSYEETLDSLTSGGYFPDLADDPQRFADIIPDIRRYLREAIPDLPAPRSPVYCHQDYRYGNLLIDPVSGQTNAVIDWGLIMAAPPAFNLANAESLLLSPDTDPTARTAALRRRFRQAYAETREGWSFDAQTRDRMEVYRLCCRLDAMACLPLWYQDATPEQRDVRAEEHRQFIRQYVDI